MNTYPLVVDLDGTLINANMLYETALKLIAKNPFSALKFFFWFSKGKAFLKEKIAHRSEIAPDTLPYNQELLAYLKQQRELGRKLILCTASNIRLAKSVAAHLNLFDEVFASDGCTNLSGTYKAVLLTERFGKEGFDYAGNTWVDIAVWKQARKAIVVNSSPQLLKKTQRYCEVEEYFPRMKPSIHLLKKTVRMNHWVKNTLLFVPLLAAHQVSNLSTWIGLIVAFFAFSLCASSVYIFNDLLDLENDRRHSEKRKRPFASGAVPTGLGLFLSPLLFICSLGLASLCQVRFVELLIFYFFVAGLYSFRLKRLVLIDCMTLALLYTIRIIAGAVVAKVNLSFWLLIFSVFLFLSLAFIKRYAELKMQGKDKLNGREYWATDAPLIQTLGLVSGYMSVLVLAFYLNSSDVLILYTMPQLIWLSVPILLFWVSWMWIQAHRGNMHDDPVLYAIKDKSSLLAGFLFTVVLTVGALGWPF